MILVFGQDHTTTGKPGLPWMRLPPISAPNAAMESFFGLLKRERVNRVRYRTRDETRADLFDYIEVFITGNDAMVTLATSARLTSKGGQPDLSELSTETGQVHSVIQPSVG